MFYIQILTNSYTSGIQGRVNSTKPYRPYRIIYNEETDSKAEAVKREKELKLTEGRRFLRKFI
jgi:putative endonuclease